MNEKNEKKVIRTWSRRSTILPDFMGHTDGRPQWPEVYPGVCHREYGGA